MFRLWSVVVFQAVTKCTKEGIMPTNKKVALITGATRGIGFETARQLGQKGITVVVGGKAQQDATEAAGKLVAEGLEAYPLAVDITNDADRKAAASFVAEKFGKLDILINNAVSAARADF